jgi:hypothetical protein
MRFCLQYALPLPHTAACLLYRTAIAIIACWTVHLLDWCLKAHLLDSDAMRLQLTLVICIVSCCEHTH